MLDFEQSSCILNNYTVYTVYTVYSLLEERRGVGEENYPNHQISFSSRITGKNGTVGGGDHRGVRRSS